MFETSTKEPNQKCILNPKEGLNKSRFWQRHSVGKPCGLIVDEIRRVDGRSFPRNFSVGRPTGRDKKKQE